MKRVLILIASMAMLTACGGKQDKKAQLDALRVEYAKIGEQIRTIEAELAAQGVVSQEPTVSVKAEVVKPSEFKRKIIVQGSVDGDNVIGVNPKASGEIVWMNAKVGQRVNAGQTLARIDDAILRKGLSELETAYELAKTVYDRQQKLWKDSIGSEIQYIQAKNTKESLEAKLASFKEQIDLYNIKSPISGTIERVEMKVGQLVAPQVTVAVVGNTSRSMKVVADVSESYSSLINAGDNLKVSFTDIKTDLDLKISTVSNFINPLNRSFRIEAEIPAGINGVKANMLAKVAIETYRISDVIVVPVNLVFKNGSGEYLYVLEQVDGRDIGRRRSVTTGMVSENNVVIESGLAEGETVVTFGYQLLDDGMAVKVQQ